MFSTVLVANRGEVAVRVMRTLRRLGIRAATVYSDADARARHVAEADVAVRIGPADAARSYLSVDAVVEAALLAGAEAVHPGYGFLAERPELARACAAAGLVFVGPSADVIETMGDKIRAKQTVEAAGVPVVPGVHRHGLTDDDLVAAAGELGFPVLLKPSAGGGGKGMRRVDDAADVREAVAAARREARAAFGDDTLLLERYVERPRHIEVQVLADAYGSVVHLGERECTLQRRHQKVVEETPSPLLGAEARAAMCEAGVRVARACGYVGAGTVELVVAPDDEFWFLEMNTRLQVEHPVTELVTGIDIVEQQLRCAAGERFAWTQDDVRASGHAVEARVYAEDPARGFLPTGGRVLALAEPTGRHVRVDSGLAVGTEVGSAYDPMLAKIATWGATREEALHRLDNALAATVVLGVGTNVVFLRALLNDDDVRAGRLDTGLVERKLGSLVAAGLPSEVPLVAVLARLTVGSSGGDPFDALVGWRVGGPQWVVHVLETADHGRVEVEVRGGPRSADLRLDGTTVHAKAERAGDRLLVTLDGVRTAWWFAEDGSSVWVGRDGAAWHMREVAPRIRAAGADESAGPLVAPMPGTVSAVHVGLGDTVSAGQPVVSVEAMKMEHVVRATTDGVVAELPVAVGDVVPLDAVLAVVHVPTNDAPTNDAPTNDAPTEVLP